MIKKLTMENQSLTSNWEYGTLEDAVNKGSSNISLNKVKEDDGEYQLYSAKGYNKNISFFHQEKEYLAIIKDGAGIGRVSKHPAKSSVVATMQYLIPKKGFDIGFIQYFLNGIDFESHRQGSTIPHVYFKDYKSEPFPLLPLTQQKQIVATLDKAFAAIDIAKANAEQNLQNAKELFESYLQNVFENKGDDWEIKKLSDICEVKDGTHDSPKYVDEKNGVPFITQKNILEEGLSFEKIKFISQEDHNHFYKRSNVAYNDILFSMIGANRGMACIVDNKIIFSIKNVGLIKSNKQFLSKFILYFLKSPIAKKYVSENSSGSAQGFIALGKLRSFTVPFINLTNQKELVETLDIIDNHVQSVLLAYKEELNNLEELKKSILQKAFSGELTNKNKVA